MQFISYELNGMVSLQIAISSQCYSINRYKKAWFPIMLELRFQNFYHNQIY